MNADDTPRTAKAALNDAVAQLNQATESINWAALHVLDGSLGHGHSMTLKVNELTIGPLRDRLRQIEVSISDLRTVGKVGIDLPPGRSIRGIDGKTYPKDRATYIPAQIQTLRASGMSMRRIAERLGCSVGTVHRHLH